VDLTSIWQRFDLDSAPSTGVCSALAAAMPCEPR
jgi:hypothetical protein